MIDPIEEKFKEFTERMNTEDNVTVINEAITYLEGIKDNEKNSITQEQIGGIIISVNIAKALMILSKTLKDENDKLKSQHNSSLERIIRLEKRFDDLDAGK